MTKPDLTPANQNPWYVLMTLYGEQEGKYVDQELAEKNRKVWNAWSCQGLTDEDRAQVCASSRVGIAETKAWGQMDANVRERHRIEMKNRNDEAFSYPGFPEYTELLGLSEIVFSNTIVLEKTIFTQAAYFGSATFTQAAYFGSATFTQTATFGSATFTQTANFRAATFEQTTDFGSATFTQAAYFNSATFEQTAYFHFATFTQAAYFDSATFDGPAKFVGTKFGLRGGTDICVPNFTEATFVKLVSFRKADFVTHYPVLEGTAFLAKLVVTATPALWPKERPALLDVAKENSPIPTKEDAKASCATLRHEIGRQGLPEDEHFFFRREMEFSRIVALSDDKEIWPYFKAWPYWLFKTFSGYGESIERPISALCGMFGFGFGALLAHFSANTGIWSALKDAAAVRDAAAVSFSNLLPVFGFGRIFLADELKTLTAGLEFLSGAQTVLALPPLFFLGIGLRKRFRIR